MDSQLKEDTLILSSNMESINKVNAYVDQLFESDSMPSDESYGNIVIAVTEAVNNAIVHGNLSNSDKKVALKYSRNESRLSFTITDEGSGFEPETVPDPTLPQNLEKTRGRGIFLMNHLSDEVIYHGKGNKIELIFNHQ